MTDVDLPGLEATLRSSLGELLDATLGGEWQQELSRRVRDQLTRTRDVASNRREGVPADPWKSAGFAEIRAVVEHFLRILDSNEADSIPAALKAGLCQLWTSTGECTVDIARVTSGRDQDAHPGVVPDRSTFASEEVAVIAKRLRLGCEAIRRQTAQSSDEWWPYIERVTCTNIPDWFVFRGANRNDSTNLNEDDTLEFDVDAVNPLGPDDDLEYRIRVVNGTTPVRLSDWQATNRFMETAAPAGRRVVFRFEVRRVGSAGADDQLGLLSQVRPGLRAT